MPRLSAVLVTLAVVLGACGSHDSTGRSGDSSDGVTTRTSLLTASTPGVTIWAPTRAGSWPVVFAVHGQTGRASDFAPLAEDLASRGAVVVAPDFREETAAHTVTDLVCAYQGMASIVGSYGGDLRRITTIGFSAGADWALALALRTDLEDPLAPYGHCLAGVAHPIAAVAISGCYVTLGPVDNGALRDVVLPVAGNPTVRITLVAGGADTICPAAQSQTAGTWLRDAGYEPELVVIPNGDHGNEIYRDWDHHFAAITGDPAGQQTALLIFAAATSSSASAPA